MTLYPRSCIRVAKRSRVSPVPTISPPAAASQEASPSQPSDSSDKQNQGLEMGRREISQCQEKASTRTFSLLNASASIKELPINYDMIIKPTGTVKFR